MVKLTENLARKSANTLWQTLYLTRAQTRSLQAPVAAGTLPIFCKNFSWYYIIYRGIFLCGPEDGVFTHRMTIGHMIHQDMVRGTLFSKPYGFYPLLTMDGNWIEPKLGPARRKYTTAFYGLYPSVSNNASWEMPLH